MIAGIWAVILATVAIGIMIYAGWDIAVKSAKDDANRNIKMRARIMAERMYHEKLANTRIQVSQRLVVVEDDLK